MKNAFYLVIGMACLSACSVTPTANGGYQISSSVGQMLNQAAGNGAASTLSASTTVNASNDALGKPARTGAAQAKQVMATKIASRANLAGVCWAWCLPIRKRRSRTPRHRLHYITRRARRCSGWSNTTAASQVQSSDEATTVKNRERSVKWWAAPG